MPLKVFINYRHDDTDSAALLLYDRLAGRFGAENVFLDVKTLQPGTKWLEEIKAHGARGTVVLALVGRTWLASLKDHQRLTAEDPEDFVVLELELALGRWPGTVIPVLIGGATVPEPVRLPRPIRALADCQAVTLRHASFDQDLADLIARLEAIAAEHERDQAPDKALVSVAQVTGALPEAGDHAPEHADQAPEPADHAPEHADQAPEHADRERREDATSVQLAMPGPDSAHYDTVLECMVDEGTVVPVLGSRVRGALPDAEELAAHLSSTFRLRSESHDLAEVAQHVAMAKGPSFLFRAMKDVLRLQSEPNDVHAFLARFPGRLEELGLPARYQMIVTTNYDAALDRAFDAVDEQYDLAVFIGSGNDKGKFVHVPWSGEPRLISEPSKYRDFPIDPYDELERTLIVKIHGAADGGEGGYHWDRSYVLTEDQYIDYLVTDQIGSVVPLQILNKLTSSHCLFLGYAMRDWSLRVFLKRVWQGRPLEDRSWAIEHAPDELEKDFWSALQVELLAASPNEYANQLGLRLAERGKDGQ